MAEPLIAESLLKLRLENGKTVEEELRSVRWLARLLDTRFNLLGFKFGLDSIIGLVPIGGDIVTGVVGFFSVLTAIRLKLPLSAVLTILWNLGFDTIIGAVPIFGDIFDFFFRSHAKNFKVIEKHLKRQAEKRAKAISA
jgi:Domain of unknown function (DUF4112)